MTSLQEGILVLLGLIVVSILVHMELTSEQENYIQWIHSEKTVTEVTTYRQPIDEGVTKQMYRWKVCDTNNFCVTLERERSTHIGTKLEIR